jgi:signal transduction histidine kinase
MNILVIDDEIDQVETVKRGLRGKGYAVFQATDPCEALDRLHGDTRIDMLITDYIMPSMNGIELLEIVRKGHPTLPVIMMTAYGNKELLVNAIHNNCDGYIEKPFTLDQLLKEIERAKANASRHDHCNEVIESIPMFIHQINNPIMAISGTAELAMLSLDNPHAVKKYMKRIIASIKEVSKLNKRMLNSAKDIKSEVHGIDIVSVINDCINMFYDLILTKNIRLDKEFPNLQIMVTGSKLDFEQLFKNIILNSIESMQGKEKGTLKITIKLQQHTQTVVISLEDTGCGISKDKIGKIFDSYFTQKQNGTGLGLAVVKKVIERYNGRIEVESEAGEWTKFKVYLPTGAADMQRSN